MLRNAAIVYLKELREVLRDRRTLVLMLLVPMVATPLLGSLVGRMMESAAQRAEQRAMEDSREYALFGADQAEGLEALIAERAGLRRVELVDQSEIPQAVAEGRIAFALVVVPDAERIAVELHYDDAPMFGRMSDRLEPIIEAYGAQLRSHRLTELGVVGQAAQVAVVDPVEFRLAGLASDREKMGERMGGMLPYMLLLFCFMGSLYPATDLVAGEKERGTLETLLLAPVSRTALVLGKFGVVFTTGTLSAVLGTASMGVWLLAGAGKASAALGSAMAGIGPGDFVLVAVLFVPVAAVFASVLLSVSAYAKSFKEAQSYGSALMMVVFVPAFVALIPGIELDWKMALVPVSNVTLAIKEVVKGTLAVDMLALIFGSSVLFAGALLAGCVAWFSREEVLFRQ